MVPVLFLWACARPDPVVLPAAPCPEPPVSTPAPAGLVVVVRHAEKGDGDDPPLTAEGAARAELLADMLRSVDLDAVHSTDTARTQSTALPTAVAHGLTVRSYADEEALVDELLAVGGGHLVVGHSDTVPALVSLLDPDADPEGYTEDDYDRMYLVTLGDAPSTTLLRFGEP